MNKISAPDIISDTLKVYKDNFKSIFLTSLAVIGIAGIISAILVQISDGVVVSIISQIIILIAAFLLIGFMVHVVDEHRKENPIDSKALLAKTRPDLLNLIVNGLIRQLLIAFGFALLIVPGIVLAVFLSVCAATIVDESEKKNALEALFRSAEVTKGNRWSVFFVYLLLILLMIGLAILSFVALLLIGLVFSHLGAVGSVVIAIAVVLLYVLFVPIAGLIEGVLFYELRDGRK